MALKGELLFHFNVDDLADQFADFLGGLIPGQVGLQGHRMAPVCATPNRSRAELDSIITSSYE
jgi:hypothetical protein